MTQPLGRVDEGTLLWEPSSDLIERSRITLYMRWLAETRGKRFADYDDLWRWSVDDLEGFWGSLWEYFEVIAHRPYTHVLAPSVTGNRVEGARWFQGAELNYAEHCLRRRDDHPAIIAAHESGSMTTITYAELSERTAEIAAGLRALGVGKGDSVVAFLPNNVEAVAATLAAASIGAAWSSCPPEFGTPSVIDRFQQLGPKVLLAVDGYTYNGKRFESLEAVARIQQSLPTLVKTVVLPYLDPKPSLGGLTEAVFWEEFLIPGQDLMFEPVPFDHPLYVLYSSGTTGAPKAIVHGHGGTLVEHYKGLALHLNLAEDDCFFWFSTTGWMMWNLLLSGLLVGSTIVLYDGSPAHPDMYALWRLAERAKITCLGVSAAFVLGCMKAGIEPSRELDMSALRTVGSTGAPLPPEGYAWLYRNVGRDLLVGSISGGTDVLTAFTMSTVLLPTHAGEMQCRALGCKVESYDEAGTPVIDEVGELVITEPMPSMPIRFLNDPDGSRLHESYFDVYPDVWRHGDWLKVTPRGTCVIYGRSDSTLNRSGVRMGTSEFYRVVEEMPQVLDSLVIDTSQLGTEGRLLLFVVLAEGVDLDDALMSDISARIRGALSPRHVPDEVRVIAEIPRTLNGKKLEVPVKKILAGVAPSVAVSFDALANPAALDPFVELARYLAGGASA
jgi:acetoacetyl-CoA synthetase